MRNVQRSASRGGERTPGVLLVRRNCCVACERGSKRATVAGRGAINCTARSVLANGCAAIAVFFFALRQQALFAHEPGAHACSLATFDKMHAADRMAHDKLKEGIEGFSKALEDLEKLLEKRLSDLPKS